MRWGLKDPLTGQSGTIAGQFHVRTGQQHCGTVVRAPLRRREVGLHQTEHLKRIKIEFVGRHSPLDEELGRLVPAGFADGLTVRKA